MIKFENIEVFNFEGALRGMRNPLESWNKSNNYYKYDADFNGDRQYIICEEDIKLALKLIKAGSEHSKFTRQIFVSMDITAPDYWWKEQSTYKVGTVENSTSTMHKITSRLLTENDFTWDIFMEVNEGNINDEYFNKMIKNDKQNTLFMLNELIERYQETKDKRIWRAIIQRLPMSFNYKRTCTNNYQGLRNMYLQRRNHKLKEWHDFCDMIENLPYSQLITLK